MERRFLDIWLTEVIVISLITPTLAHSDLMYQTSGRTQQCLLKKASSQILVHGTWVRKQQETCRKAIRHVLQALLGQHCWFSQRLCGAWDKLVECDVDLLFLIVGSIARSWAVKHCFQTITHSTDYYNDQCWLHRSFVLCSLTQLNLRYHPTRCATREAENT